MKTIYLDIDSMRQILSRDAFDIYMGCFNAVYLVLSGSGSYWYEIHNGITNDVLYVLYSTKELDNYYLRMDEVNA